MKLPVNEILVGDALERLRELPGDSVSCCITSPPYWGLRDYGVAGQIGLEQTYGEYVDKLVEVLREVRRVLRADGTLWLNLGDCYYSGNCGGYRTDKHRWGHSKLQSTNRGNAIDVRPNRLPQEALKEKDLVGIPWRLAFALQADGWWLRKDIIWAKKNCMPESVTDRPTSSHEYIFLLSKSARYYYDADAIREPVASPEQSTAEDAARAFSRLRGLIPAPRQLPMKTYGSGNKERFVAQVDGERGRVNNHLGSSIPWTYDGRGRNKRSVWWIATKPFPDAHFAVFPEEVVAPCILAGTSEKGNCAQCGTPWLRMTERNTVNLSNAALAGSEIAGKGHPSAQVREDHDVRDGPTSLVRTTGWNRQCGCEIEDVLPAVVLDPFIGSGTTAWVALKASRNFVGIELNPEYAKMAEDRIRQEKSQMRLA